MSQQTIQKEISSRNSTIDIIKGVAILFVILAHFRFFDAEWKKYLFPFWVDMAVPTFMIISGYLAAKSFEKRDVKTVEEAYELESLISKSLRLTIPYIIFYIASLIVCPIIYKGNDTIMDLTIRRPLKLLLTGGFGPGSYYYPIMIQFILLVPILYLIIKKYRTIGLFICILLNIIYEGLQISYGISADTYRLLVFRYISIISFGIYFSLLEHTDRENKIDKTDLRKQNSSKLRIGFQITLFVIGFVYIVAHSYFGFTTPLIPYWTRTHWIPSLLIVPIIYNLLKVRMNFKPLEILGKASFNIFFAQCFYYVYYSERIYERYASRYIQLPISIFICLVSGLIFYYLENALSKRLIKKFRYMWANKKFDSAKFNNNIEKIFIYK